MSAKKNAAYNVAYRVFSILLPLVTAPYLTRTVGQTGKGLYDYAWSISEIFVIIATMGLTDYGVRAIAKVRDDAKQLSKTFSEIYIMQVLVSLLVLLVWLGYVTFGAGQEKTIVLHLTMMSVSCLVNVDWCLMGLDQFKSIALRNTCVKLLAAASVFIFVKSAEDVWIYGFAWSLATLLGCLLCWPGLKGKVHLQRVPFRDVMKHFLPCMLLLVSVLAVRVYRTMDKIMVGAIAGMAQNGLYSSAEQIIYCLSGFISAIGTVLMPKASNLQAHGKEKQIRGFMELSMKLMMCMTCAMAFGIAAVADVFAPLFYGEDFAYSGVLMVPLGFTLILIGFANVVRTQWILPSGDDKLVLKAVSTGAIVNLIINGLLIPVMGAMGAVIGTLFAEASVPLVQFLFLRKELPYRRFFRYALTYSAMGVVMLLVVQLVGALMADSWWEVAIRVLVGAGVYGGLCLCWWRKTDDREIMRLLHLKRFARKC